MNTAKKITPPTPRLKLVAVMEARPFTTSALSLAKSLSHELTRLTSSSLGMAVAKALSMWRRPLGVGVSWAMKLTLVM
jgi:hypothetical protein